MLRQRAVSDYESKVVLVNSLAINTWGLGHIRGTNIERHILQFATDNECPEDPGEFAVQLADYFHTVLKEDGINHPLGCFVAGWKGNAGVVWLADISATSGHAKLMLSTERPNMSWGGQIGVASRLILGYDQTLVGLPPEGIENVEAEQLARAIRSSASVLMLPHSNIQDAIDMCEFLIRATEFWQDHTLGTAGNPDAVSGVGGPIDVAVVTPEGARFVRKKEPR